jgi:hypothetical protein
VINSQPSGTPGFAALHKNEWVEGIEEQFGIAKVPRAGRVIMLRKKDRQPAGR